MALCFPWGTKKKSPHEQIVPQPDAVLFDIIHWSPWDAEERRRFDQEALRKRIAEHPEGVGAKYEFKSAGRGSAVRYPFQRAVSLGASLDILKDMHEIHPEAIREMGAFSSTPLHIACAYQASLDVIAFLLQEYPQAATIRNKHGYLPIHNACEYGVSTPKVIDLLTQAYPEGLGKRNKLGQTPLLTVQRKGEAADPEVLRLLYEHTTDIARTEEPDSSSMHFSG